MNYDTKSIAEVEALLRLEPAPGVAAARRAVATLDGIRELLSQEAFLAAALLREQEVRLSACGEALSKHGSAMPLSVLGGLSSGAACQPTHPDTCFLHRLLTPPHEPLQILTQLSVTWSVTAQTVAAAPASNSSPAEDGGTKRKGKGGGGFVMGRGSGLFRSFVERAAAEEEPEAVAEADIAAR